MIYFQKPTMIFEFLKQRKTLIVRAFLIFLSLWVIFLALFPFILSKGLLESQINKKINGNLAIGKSKLSWFRDQRFEDIKLSDVDGQTIVSIKSIKTSLSLLDLISGKNDFKQTSIDGLIGNIFASRGLPTNLTTSLNTTSFVQAQNTKSRAHPAFIFKKPFSGDFHIDNSSFLIQSQEHDPIYFKDIQFSCTLFKQRKSVIAHLACETSQNNLSGAVDLKLEMGGFDEKGQLIITPLDKEIFFLSPEGYINLGAQVTNLPSQGIDHLLRLYNPNLSQIFSNATGGPLTLKANLHVLKDKSKIQLSVDANDLKVQFAGALQQNQFFLTEPSTARLRIRPAFIANVSQAISSKLTLSINEATDALIQIDRLTTPLDLSNFNFNNLSCNAQFSLSPMKFLGDKRFSSFEIKQIKGTIDTFDLNENLTLHLNALAYEDNKPIHLKLDGELTKLIDNQMELLGIDQVKAHFIAQAKDFPTKLVLTLFKNKSLATELLGPTLNIDSTIKGSLQSADIALAFNSSRLNIPEMSWKLKDKKHFILSSPSTVELRATPVLAQKAMSPKLSILHPFLLTGKLNQCEFFINQKQMQLQALDLNLDSASFDFILSDYKPCHVNESSAHFCSSAGSNVELLLSTQVDLPSDLPFYQLDKSIASTFKLNDFLAYLKGSPCQVQTDFKAPNWTVSLNGYADRHWNYELMQEATLSMNNPAFLPSTQSVIESPRITLQINPCSINLLDLNFSTLNLNGKFSADNLNLSSDSFTHTFKNFSAVFEYCGQANYLKLTAKSDQVLENVSLVCESLLQSGRLNFADAKYNFAADVKKLPPNIFKIITPYTYDYESILGPTLDLSISSNFQKNDSINGIISYELSSSILHSKGNFSIGNKIQSGDQCIELDYFMSPAGYFAVSRALKKDLDSTLFLEEPLHLKAHINKLSKNIPKHLNDFQLSFDGNFSVDKFVSNKGSLFDLYGSFNTSDITQNLKLDLSASTNNSEGEKGGAYLSAEFTEPFNATTATINHKINGFINCQLEHFPTAILHDFISFNSPQLPSLPQLLGSSFNMNCTANLESGRGPLQFELNSINLNSRFALIKIFI